MSTILYIAGPIARRAGHMLRMHWAHVQRRGLAEWSGT